MKNKTRYNDKFKYRSTPSVLYENHYQSQGDLQKNPGIGLSLAVIKNQSALQVSSFKVTKKYTLALKTRVGVIDYFKDIETEIFNEEKKPEQFKKNQAYPKSFFLFWANVFQNHMQFYSSVYQANKKDLANRINQDILIDQFESQLQIINKFEVSLNQLIKNHSSDLDKILTLYAIYIAPILQQKMSKKSNKVYNFAQKIRSVTNKAKHKIYQLKSEIKNDKENEPIVPVYFDESSVVLGENGVDNNKQKNIVSRIENHCYLLFYKNKYMSGNCYYKHGVYYCNDKVFTKEELCIEIAKNVQMSKDYHIISDIYDRFNIKVANKIFFRKNCKLRKEFYHNPNLMPYIYKNQIMMLNQASNHTHNSLKSLMNISDQITDILSIKKQDLMETAKVKMSSLIRLYRNSISKSFNSIRQKNTKKVLKKIIVDLVINIFTELALLFDRKNIYGLNTILNPIMVHDALNNKHYNHFIISVCGLLDQLKYETTKNHLSDKGCDYLLTTIFNLHGSQENNKYMSRLCREMFINVTGSCANAREGDFFKNINSKQLKVFFNNKNMFFKSFKRSIFGGSGVDSGVTLDMMCS